MIVITMYKDGELIDHDITSIDGLNAFFKDLGRIKAQNYHANVYNCNKLKNSRLIAVKPYKMLSIYNVV